MSLGKAHVILAYTQTKCKNPDQTIARFYSYVLENALSPCGAVTWQRCILVHRNFIMVAGARGGG